MANDFDLAQLRQAAGIFANSASEQRGRIYLRHIERRKLVTFFTGRGLLKDERLILAQVRRDFGASALKFLLARILLYIGNRVAIRKPLVCGDEPAQCKKQSLNVADSGGLRGQNRRSAIHLFALVQFGCTPQRGVAQLRIPLLQAQAADNFLVQQPCIEFFRSLFCLQHKFVEPRTAFEQQLRAGALLNVFAAYCALARFCIASSRIPSLP